MTFKMTFTLKIGRAWNFRQYGLRYFDKT